LNWNQKKTISIQKEFNNLLNEKRKALAATQIQKKKSEAIKSSNKVKKKKKVIKFTKY
jgi:hypothetical protein